MEQKIITLILSFIVLILIIVCFQNNLESFDDDFLKTKNIKNICDNMKKRIKDNTHVGVIKPKALKKVAHSFKEHNMCTDGNYYNFGSNNFTSKYPEIDNFYMIFLPVNLQNNFILGLYFKPNFDSEYIFNYSKTNGELIFAFGIDSNRRLFYKLGSHRIQKTFDDSIILKEDRFYFLEIKFTKENLNIFFENLTKNIKHNISLEDTCPVIILGRKNNYIKDKEENFSGTLGSIRVRNADKELGIFYRESNNLTSYDTPRGVTLQSCKQECVSKTDNNVYCDRLCEGCIDPENCLWLHASKEEEEEYEQKMKNLIPPKVNAIPGDKKITLIWSSKPNIDNYIIDIKETYSDVNQTNKKDPRIIIFNVSDCNGTQCTFPIEDLENGTYYNITLKAQTGDLISSQCSNVLSIAPNGIRTDASIHSALIETDESLKNSKVPMDAQIDLCQNENFKLNNKSLLDNYSLY